MPNKIVCLMQLYTFTFWQLSSSSGPIHFLISSFCFHSICKSQFAKKHPHDDCVFSAHKTKLHIFTALHKVKYQKCGLCNYSSKCPSTLKCHMMVHTCHKDFICKQCDYSCAHAGKLKQNIQAKSRLNVQLFTLQLFLYNSR